MLVEIGFLVALYPILSHAYLPYHKYKPNVGKYTIRDMDPVYEETLDVIEKDW